MQAVQDPIEYVFRGYTRFAEANARNISESAVRIGEKALELFMFAAGGNELNGRLQETTTRFYEQQQQQQELDSAPTTSDFQVAIQVESSTHH